MGILFNTLNKMLNQDQIRAQQAAVQTSLFTATMATTPSPAGYQSRSSNM